jgi:hypothetical protein
MSIKRFRQIDFVLFTIILFLAFAVSATQAQVWTASITVENFDPIRPETKNVSFGVNPNATDGIDEGLDVSFIPRLSG